MGEEKSVGGVQYTHRDSGNRSVKDFEIQLSTDNETFTSAGDFVLEPGLGADANLGPQSFGFTATNARYIKLILKTSYDETEFAAISEFNAYVQ